jgi:hypothetical protein
MLFSLVVDYNYIYMLQIDYVCILYLTHVDLKMSVSTLALIKFFTFSKGC